MCFSFKGKLWIDENSQTKQKTDVISHTKNAIKLLKFLLDTFPFCVATDIPVWVFCWRLLQISIL